MNIVHLRERLAARFPDVEQIEGSVIRFTKRIGNVPYAVYYLDIAEELPQSQEMLMKYQDRVIGSRVATVQIVLKFVNPKRSSSVIEAMRENL
jgi:hypothetical protein